MNWFNKLEQKYGRYAIKNLMLYIIVLYALGYIINMFTPPVYSTFFALNAEQILHGQIWRIFTFIIMPPSNTSILFIFFVLYFYYMIGSVLERTWGAFRFNVYFFTGVLLHVIAAILIYLIFGVNLEMNTYYLNLALFMAFAIEYPDMQVLLLFVIPIKIKWMAILDAVFFGLTIVGGYLVTFLPYSVWYGLASLGILQGSPWRPLQCYVVATAALVSMLNFLIFVILYKKGPAKSQVQRNYAKAMKTARNAEEKRKASFNERFYNANSEKSTWASANKPYVNGTKGAKHRCVICGRTEFDGDDLVFRYCSKCKGNLEYCQDHLYTHVHVTDTNNDNVININK